MVRVWDGAKAASGRGGGGKGKKRSNLPENDSWGKPMQ
jgi:hypothetical protein